MSPVNERIAERTRAAALHAAPWVISLYLALALIHGWFRPIEGSEQVAAALLLGALLVTAIFAGLQYGQSRHASIAITAVGLISVGVSLVFIAVNGEPSQSVVPIITILATSYFLVWRWSSLIVVGVAFLGWFWLMPRADGGVWIHWFMNMASASVLAVLVAESRARNFGDLALQTERAEAASKAQRTMADDLAKKNAALETARDLAVRTNADKDDLIANMSHEVRTPLSGVVGMLALLDGTPLTTKKKHYVETARTSGEMLMRLINDMLDFSAMGAKKLKLDRREFDLMDIVESSLEILALDASRKNTALACVSDPELPQFVFGDAERIQQILTNLLSNAVKNTVDGEIIVHVRKDLGRMRTSVIKISVTDTGAGISEKDQAKVFDSFFRAGDNHTVDGTGLGLAITKQLVQLMDGNIGFTSTPKLGSSFWFEFPLEPGSAPNAGDQRTDRRQLSGARIFGVEPEPAYQQQLDAQLLLWGVDAMIFPNIQAALNHMADHPDPPPQFGIVSTKSGRNPAYRIADELRQRFGKGAPRLTLLLEIGVTVNSEDLSLAGFSSALSKPIRGKDLLRCLTTSSWSGMLRATTTQHTPPERDGNNHILVADDNPVGQLVATANLKALGYRVQVVADGAQAIEAVANGQFAAVLMDCQMPVLDGLDATREIRKWERKLGRSPIPIIAVTASAMRSDREARQKILDPSILDQLKAANPAAARATVAAFLHHTPIRIAQLWSHIDRREVPQAAGLAHMVKGSAAQLGAVEISKMAAAIESHYLEELAGFPDVTVTQLEAALARLEGEISDYQ